jgi:hypothetical protein
LISSVINHWTKSILILLVGNPVPLGELESPDGGIHLGVLEIEEMNDDERNGRGQGSCSFGSNHREENVEIGFDNLLSPATTFSLAFFASSMTGRN